MSSSSSSSLFSSLFENTVNTEEMQSFDDMFVDHDSNNHSRNTRNTRSTHNHAVVHYKCSFLIFLLTLFFRLVVASAVKSESELLALAIAALAKPLAVAALAKSLAVVALAKSREVATLTKSLAVATLANLLAVVVLAKSLAVLALAKWH